MNSRIHRRHMAVAALAVGAAALSASVALGAVKYETSASLDSIDVVVHSVSYSGHVDSEKSKCIAGRVVQIRATTSGEPGDHDKPVGHPETTDVDGNYVVDDNHTVHNGDQFYAEVTKRKFGRKGHRKTCLADISPVYTYEG